MSTPSKEKLVPSAPGPLDAAVKSFLAGGIAGAAGKTLSAPMDRVMILKQVAVPSDHPASSMSVLRTIMREGGSAKGAVNFNGCAKLWKGNLLNCARAFPKEGITFGLNDYLRDLFGVPEGGGGMSPAGLAAGGVSGIVATTSTSPLDVLRARMAGTLGGAVKPLRTPFPGLLITLLGSGTKESVRFGAYHEVMSQKCWSKFRGGYGPLSGEEVHRLICPLLSGSAAGAVSTSIVFPIDTIRRRVQLAGGTTTGLAQATELLGSVGVRGLYRGVSLALLKSLPSNAARFWVFEQLKFLMGLGDKISAHRDERGDAAYYAHPDLQSGI